MPVTFEELKKRFKFDNVVPYGECVIIPGTEFDPDWEDELSSQGCELHFVDIAGKPVTLMQKGKDQEEEVEEVEEREEVAEREERDKVEKVEKVEDVEEVEKVTDYEATTHGSMAEFPWSNEDEKKLLQRMNQLEGTVYERVALLMPEFSGRTGVALRQKYYKLTGLKAGSKRKGRPKPELLHVPWNAQDDDLLIELWKKRMTVSAIAQKVVGRSYESVKMRLQMLKQLGRIKPRWERKSKTKGLKKREKVEKKEQAKKTEEIPESIPTSIPTEILTHAPIELPVKEDPIVTLLREIRDLLRPRDFNFDYYCRSCGESGNVSNSERIYEFCPVCGKPLLISNVEEASS